MAWTYRLTATAEKTLRKLDPPQQRRLRRMRAADERSPSPELEAITGLVPENVAAEAEYRRHVWEKHGG